MTESDHTLAAHQVAWHVDGRTILQDVSLDVAAGELVGVIGPNGSGKSTFLRTVYRVLKPAAGWIRMENLDVWQLSVREVARRSAAVLQETPTEFDFGVADLVAMGRTPHKRPLQRDTTADHQIVADALERVGMADSAERRFSTLSGGEKQRVMIARALAQQPRVLILDEPTSHLDVHYQLEILDLVRGLGLTTLIVLHDLNLAAEYCDRLYVLAAGRIVAAGAPPAVLQPDLLQDVFGVEVAIQPHPRSGKPHLVFLGRAARTHSCVHSCVHTSEAVH